MNLRGEIVTRMKNYSGRKWITPMIYIGRKETTPSSECLLTHVPESNLNAVACVNEVRKANFVCSRLESVMKLMNSPNSER